MKAFWFPLCCLGFCFMGASTPGGCSADELRGPYKEIGRVSFAEVCSTEEGYSFENESRGNNMIIIAWNTADSTNSIYFRGVVQKGESVLLRCPGVDSGYFQIETRG